MIVVFRSSFSSSSDPELEGIPPDQQRLIFAAAMTYTTYVLEMPSMLRMDWVSRQQRFRELPFRTKEACANRFSPDEVLEGRNTGLPPQRLPAVIVAKDIVKVKRARQRGAVNIPSNDGNIEPFVRKLCRGMITHEYRSRIC